MLKKYRLVLITISILILLAIVWFANPQLLFSYLLKSDIRFVLLGLLASGLALVIRVLKWYVLLDNVKFTELMPVQLLGIAISNMTPGKVAEPAKAVLLKLRTNKDVSKTLPSVIWERLLDIIILVSFALFGIQLFGLKANFYSLSVFAVGAFVLLIAMLLVVLFIKRVGIFVFNTLRRLPLLSRVSEDFVHAFYEKKVRKRRLVICFPITVLPWILDGLVLYFAGLAVGIEITPFVAIGVITLSVLIGIASSLPGGLGSAEAVSILLLGLVGISSAPAAAVVFLARFLSFWFSILIGGLSFIYLSKKIDMKALKF